MDQFPQYYFDGNAPNVLDTIKTNFISLLGDFGFCTDVQKCTKDLVNVDVGKPSSTWQFFFLFNP